MPLSTDIKTMLVTLKSGGEIATVIKTLEKWDKVHDDFYAECAKRVPTPLSLLEKCPCYQSAERNNGHVRDSGSNGACCHCRIGGYHNENGCEHEDKYFCSGSM